MLVGTVDILMLSSISDSCVAAVGLVNQLLNLVFLLFIVGASGTMVVCSQYLGAKRIPDFLTSSRVALLLNLFLGLVVSVLLDWYAPEIVRLMEAASDIEADAIIYLKIVGAFACLHAIAVTCASVLRALELAKFPMYVSVIGNFVNVVANYILIFGHFGAPAMGVAGAAWATVLSRVVIVILLFYFLHRQLRPFSLVTMARDFLVKLRQILHIGIPGAGEMFSYASSQVLITYFITSLGTEALAARTYMMNIVIFTFVFAISISQGASIVAGHLTGKHNYRACQLLGAYAIRASIKISLLLSLILAAAAPFFVDFLTANESIQSLLITLFLVDIVLEVGRAVNILAGRLLSAVGDPLYPLYVSIIVVWLVATLGSYVVGIVLAFGLLGMWFVFTADECLRAVILWRHWKNGAWKNKSIC